MAIQDEMYKLIEDEISQTVSANKQVRTVNIGKAKEVARMLTGLSTEIKDADLLIAQYIANIEKICKL